MTPVRGHRHGALRPAHLRRGRAGGGWRGGGGRHEPVRRGRGGGHGPIGRGNQAGGIGPRGDRARRLPHAGEPLLRPLLRHLPRRARLRRPPHGLARRVRPGVAGRPRPHAPALPPRLVHRHRRVHHRPRPQLAGRAPEPGQRATTAPSWRTHVQSRVRRAGPRRAHHGLLPPRRPALLLRAGRRVHDLRQLPLLGARADAPEPADVALGHARSRGPRGRPRAHHQPIARRRLQRRLGHHARGARGRRRRAGRCTTRKGRSMRPPSSRSTG